MPINADQNHGIDPKCLSMPINADPFRSIPLNADQFPYRQNCHPIYTFPAFRVTWSIKIGSFQFLPTGLHGLCFGCCFSGLLPLRSLANGPPIGVRFWESLVGRLHSEIDQIHLSIEAQCVTTLLSLGDCHTLVFV